ncbi:MAG: type VI secretion system contractile sheath small subunit [Methylococcales bacterium]|nr:type VI secretion system contractile sheath small subunit [Methylococcales bacterium]
MRILILGDFSGSGLSGGKRQPAISKRQNVFQVDIDNFDQTMSKIAPRLHIQLDQDTASAIDLTFHRMEDFHPDALFRKLELFQGLADIRERLGNPATFTEAAEQLHSSCYRGRGCGRGRKQGKTGRRRFHAGTPARRLHREF